MGERGVPPLSRIFFTPPSSAAKKIKKNKNLAFSAAKPLKIGGFRLFLPKRLFFRQNGFFLLKWRFPAKMVEFTAIWHVFSYITFLHPLATLTVHMYVNIISIIIRVQFHIISHLEIHQQLRPGNDTKLQYWSLVKSDLSVCKANYPILLSFIDRSPLGCIP